MKLLEFNRHFGSEEECERFLKEHREKGGITCAICGGKRHRWDGYNKRWVCCGCGHERYQPIWEMMHKLRSVMGQRDGEYDLVGTIELDEGYFSTEDRTDEGEPLKKGVGSERSDRP